MSKASGSFAVQDRVHHATYGAGTITQLDTQYTVIAFDAHGTRKFLTSVVRLEPSSVPAPEKPVRGKSSKSKKA